MNTSANGEYKRKKTNPRVLRSVKVTKHSTIPYVRYSFLLCNSNFVFKIFDFKKCRDLEIHVRGHSRSLKVVPLDRLHDFLLSVL